MAFRQQDDDLPTGFTLTMMVNIGTAAKRIAAITRNEKR
jgi:hypothetical protein